MIKSITITNYLGETITIELTNPNKSGFIIKNIEGLGPSQANVNVKELATEDGGVYNSSRVSSRNITLELGFLPNPTIEDTRLKSYKYFPIKKALTFRVDTDRRVAETIGYVESNEPDIFSEEEGCQISIICPDAYFYSAGDDGLKSKVFSGVEAWFEFPFENESITEPTIEFGHIRIAQEETVYYDGDAEVGVTIYIHALGPTADIVVYNTGTRETMKISVAKIKEITGSDGILRGDDIIISTVKNNKYATLLRGGEYTNILNAITRDSSWFSLAKGDNIFAYDTEQGSTNLQFRIENRICYEGV